MTPVERARKYVRLIPGGLEGDGGYKNLFTTACILARDFNLAVKDALPILKEYNERCLPPWEERDLLENYNKALKYGKRDIGSKNSSVKAINKSRTENSALSMWTMSDFIKLNLPKPIWIVEGLFCLGGVSMIASKPKVGKSSLMLWMSLCISRGQDFLGRKCLKYKVIYLALEGNLGQLQCDLRNLSASEEDILIFHGSLKEKGFEAFSESVKQNSPCVVIVDTLGKALDVKDLNDYTEVYNALEPFVKLTRETNSLIIFTHHQNKGDSDSDNSILGSTALLASLDTYFALKKDRNNKRYFSTTQRYGDSVEDCLIQMSEDKSFSSAGDRTHVYQSEIEVRIMSTLKNTGPQSEPDLLTMVTGKTKTMKTALRVLEKQGKVSRTGTGKKNSPFIYEVPSKDISKGTSNG
ncbi:MAG: helicase RepA family protein [Bdellovibrionales bacterium]|nr:helicase RepA family protein [Bdellovibrionales bacterium]